MVRFAAPSWVPEWATLSREAVQDGGWLQTHVITAHVAMGSLLFVTSLALSLYACRLLSLPLTAAKASVRPIGGRGMSRLSTISGYSLADAPVRSRWLATLADYVELTKPRIVVLELVTVVVAAFLASPWGIDPWTLLHAVTGAALVAASAGALNQWWEQATDARMARTARRPLPGRAAEFEAGARVRHCDTDGGHIGIDCLG